jgi:small-conductance mechanosensitive channel
MQKRLAIFLSLVVFHAQGAELVKKVTQLQQGEQPIFKGVVAERQQLLDELVAEKNELMRGDAEFRKKIRDDLEEVKNKQTDNKNKQADNKTKPEDELLKRKDSVLNDLYQSLKDQQRAREQLLAIIDDLIKLLTDYLEDPNFVAYRKKQQLRERVYYTFEDLLELHEKILAQERLVAQYADQERNSNAELDSRTKGEQNIESILKKEQESLQKQLVELADNEKVAREIETLQSILELNERVFMIKKEVFSLRAKEMKYKITYYKIHESIARSQWDVFKDYLRKIKSLVKISEADMAQARDRLELKKQEYFKQKELYRAERDKIAFYDRQKAREIDVLASRYNITISDDLVNWSKKPKKTVASYLEQFQIGMLKANQQLLQNQLELLDAQIAHEDEKYIYEEMQYKIKESFYKKGLNKFLTEEEVNQEIKRYDAPRAEAEATLARFREKIGIIADVLNQQKKIVEHMQSQREELTEIKSIIFKNNPNEYITSLELLNRAESFVKESVELLGKLTGVYSGITATIGYTLRLISFGTAELRAITIWHRPEYAITWVGMKNAVPELTKFFAEIRGYISHIEVAQIVRNALEYIANPAHFLFLLMLIGFLMFVAFVRKKYLFNLSELLVIWSMQHRGLLRILAFLLSLSIRFVSVYAVGLVAWFIIFIFLHITAIQDVYVYILFYLCSIPYLLYVASKFIKMLETENAKRGYLLIDVDFQRRFSAVLSVFVYSTIAIFFFREAFLLTDYYKSEVPVILLAVNFIIFQISLILLLTKEQILNLIVPKSDFRRWLRTQVDRFYYLILLAVIVVIVLSNPYVGYGRLMLHMLFGLLYSALLVMGLVWIYSIIKQVGSSIFFTTKEDVVRERFSNAKTWFGMLILVLFFVLGGLGMVIIAKVWGWHIAYEDITRWVNIPLIGEEGAKDAISLRSLAQIVLFIFAGFVLSYGLSKFVLSKIFDLLLVENGVQHTVISITQYIVVITMIFIGFKNVGLGGLVGWVLGAMALSVGWVLKEPIGDFAAYFIILVQRPVKIGDYISISEPVNVDGVVRKITARAVVLRNKNSTMIIIPNIHIITKSVTNWNYAYNFVAFNDIEITVDFDENPQMVKELLSKAIEMHPNVLRNPKPVVRLLRFAEYGYVFMLRGFVSSAFTLDIWDIESDVRLNAIKMLREHNVKIAFPFYVFKNPQDEEKFMAEAKKE